MKLWAEMPLVHMQDGPRDHVAMSRTDPMSCSTHLDYPLHQLDQFIWCFGVISRFHSLTRFFFLR